MTRLDLLYILAILGWLAAFVYCVSTGLRYAHLIAPSISPLGIAPGGDFLLAIGGL